MAFLCRSAAMAGVRSVVSHSKTVTPKTLTAKAMSSSLPPPSRRTALCASRIAMALGSAESLMPLHSAIAAARLKSIIAADSSCWSWLSQGLALPL